MPKTAIHWFRRDLRLTDNTALRHAFDQAETVFPVFILSDWKKTHRWTGSNRQRFLCDSLRSLATNIDHLGGKLIIRSGEPVAEICKLAKESGAELVTWNHDYDPHTRQLADQLDKELRSIGVTMRTCKDLCAWEKDEVLTGEGKPFRVFTPYSKAWRNRDLPKAFGALKRWKGKTNSLASLDLPDLDFWDLSPAGDGVLEGGERPARDRLRKFLDGPVEDYGNHRDLPAKNATSRLSQDLRFGLLSIREILHRCKTRQTKTNSSQTKSIDKFVSELIWREFYMQILWNFPDVLEWEFNLKYRGLWWFRSEKNLHKWQQGETGFPIVDAGMRELLETGFMHNRVRMITAMFLTKDLHLDWREGESWFLRHLADGEIASNNGGWQWSAGTGADAAPYFRIQNPWTQTKRYDSDGEYIKRWLPELRDVAPSRFQSPPDDGESLTKNYPPPMCDHNAERNKTLEIFQNHTSSWPG